MDNQSFCFAELTQLKKQPDTIWLKEVDSIPLQSTLKNLADAFSHFFKKQNDMPRFVVTQVVNILYLSLLKQTYKNPKCFGTLEEKLAKAQRIFSKRTKGSSNGNKQCVKVARIYENITIVRSGYLHKLSTEIIKNHDFIGMEDLQVSNMLKNRKLAKASSEVS
ncbi:hypothetical protein IKE_05944 [Bacillus cereus VD196]|uniref:Probable transposase IS891/IS1136/IS1341 domain-containing protein n=1 Tax=Bacillus cereus VD196 TaxID=1053243 RepID=A0A9W5PYA8_BACCE|nr:hypothetical protein IKG_05960 [Bacillus cereus VD200]EOO60744.1 hypothetical protein IKE_05944 [Bacillus cereus VD196]